MRRNTSESNCPSKVVWLSNPKWIVDDLGGNPTFENASTSY